MAPVPTVPPGAAIVISRPDRVGDAIISSSCFDAVRRRFPENPLWFLARPVMRPLYDGHPALAGFLARTEAVEALSDRMREIGAAVIAQLQPDELCAAAAVSAGVSVRIGYEAKRGPDTLTRPDNRWEGLQHERDYNFDLLALLGIASDPAASPSVFLPPSARASVAAKLELEEPFAIINPGAHSETVRWPRERFVDLACRLQTGFGWRIVVIGTDATDPAVRAVVAGTPGAVNLAGQTDLAELGWLSQLARVHVSRDTGTAHLAAAVGCPAVTIFGRLEGPYGPTRWRPLGAPERTRLVETPVRARHWFETTRQFWRRGFREVSVDAVLAGVRAVAAR